MATRVRPIACAIAATALLDFASAAHADLSYTYIEGSYLDVEFDDSGADGDGFGAAGSVALADFVHLFGNYANSDLDGPAGVDVDYETWEAGAGLNFGIAGNVDVIGRLSYINAEVDVGEFGGFDDDGYGLYGGLRGRLIDSIELEGGIAYADFDEAGDDTALALAGRWYFTDWLALGASADIGDDVTVWGLNLRWEMPASP